ncbi:hypothetical protein [Arhodomonas sp. AD133]|uniref:hypothetical protein n=1 Tax=Arhodomonas sp. AD133 TaxID=3415009 RepID=UPI003EBB4D70
MNAPASMKLHDGSNASAIVPGIVCVTLAAMMYAALGWPIIVLVVPMLAAYPFYLLTFHRHLPSPSAILPLYLLAIAWQFIHMAEEFATDFQYYFPLVNGGAHSSLAPGTGWGDSLFITFNMIANAGFVIGALGIVLQHRPPTFLICFFTFGMLWNGFGHPALAYLYHDVYGSSWYFPGLLTSPGHLLLSLALVARIWRSTRAHAAAHRNTSRGRLQGAQP